MLEREEYVEQAFFFRTLAERMRQNQSAQDLLVSLREEVLTTTKLPLALDFLVSELRLHGAIGPGMRTLGHYFTPFQAFVVGEAENDRRRFDLLLGLEVLAREADYRAAGCTPQGLFLYEFEALARNRLGYDRGLEAVSADPLFDATWRTWILDLRRQVGMVDFADLMYVRSQHYLEQQARRGASAEESPAVLFGPQEGKIALANRRKDPLLLFSALHRQLGYPEIPRPRPIDEANQLLPQLLRRLERVEQRLKLLEEEQKGGIDLTRFYQRPADNEP